MLTQRKLYHHFIESACFPSTIKSKIGNEADNETRELLWEISRFVKRYKVSPSAKSAHRHGKLNIFTGEIPQGHQLRVIGFGVYVVPNALCIEEKGYKIPTARQRYMSKRGYYLQTHAKEAVDTVGKIVSYTEKPITDGSDPSLKVTRLSTNVLEFSMQIQYPPKWHSSVKLSAKHWIVADAHKIDETPEGIVIYRGKAWYMPQIKSLGFSCKSLQFDLKDVYIAEIAGVSSVGGSLSGVKGGVSNKIRRQANKRIWG